MEHTKGKLRTGLFCRIFDSSDKSIARCAGDGSSYGLATNEANAERLVLCWNSHDALLEACKDIKIRIAFIGYPSEPMNEHGPDWSKEIALLEQAIAQAEPKGKEK